MNDLYAETDSVLSGSGVPIDFRIFTAGMVPDDPFVNPERPIVRMVGSSTEQDLHKDTMVASALQDMANAPTGLLIWLNHDYTVPDSLFGSLVDQPSLLHKGGFTDLHIAVEVELDNPAAARTYRYIQKKRRLGCSVGCSVEDYELVDGGKDGQPLVHITHVRPVEWSVVGVPANQRSWVENAARGIFENAIRGLRPIEDAERLAPVVKGLFPREYQKIVSGIEHTALRKSLEGVSARPSPTQRILWEPETNKFFIASGAERRLWREVPRETADLDAIRTKAFESVEPAIATSGLVTTTTGTATINTPMTNITWGGMPETNTNTTTVNGTINLTWGISGDETVIKDVADTANGEALVRQDLEDKSESGDGDGKRDAAKKAQEARSHKYHIGVKDGGNVTKPGEWASVPDSEWGDPVNYRYPMPDKTHADNAASRWGDASNRSQYSSEEQSIIGRRIAARQRHFGESDEKEKSLKIIVTDEVQENGDHLITYDTGEQVLQRSVTQADGTIELTEIVVKAAAPKVDPESDEHEDMSVESHQHGKYGMHGHDGDHDHSDAPVKGDGDGDEDDMEQKAAKKKPAEGDEEKPKDGKDVEDSDGSEVPGEDSRFVGPPLEPDDDTPSVEEQGKEEKKPAKGKGKKPAPKSEKEDYAAPKAEETDPQRVALLASYNNIGQILGFEARSFGEEGPLTKAVSSDDENQLKALACVIDDAADQLLRALGVEDSYDEQYSAEEADLLTKAGAEISSRNAKRLQMVHDMVAEFSRGMHCAAYIKKVSDAPGQMAQQEEDEQKGVEGDDEALVTKTVNSDLMMRVQVDTSQLDTLAEQMANVAKSLESLGAIKEAHAELLTVRNELLMTRKALGEIKAEAQEMQDTLQFYGNLPTGRPTRKDGREIPAGRAVDINGLTSTEAAEANGEVLAPKDAAEALKLTSVEYLPGVGRVRRWPAIVGKQFRPSLDPDQMACMTTLQIMSYYNGEESVVPVLG